jgi:hypothetical protein
MKSRRVWFLLGLFLTTLSTLALETLDTRLLSVLTWYHLSFFAVSLAMLGMAAGAVAVYLGGERFQGDAAERALARYAAIFALVIPLAHLFSISIPIVNEVSTNGVLSLAVATVALGAPFYLSGVVVTLALTRIPGRIGAVYAVDLAGASLGSLLVMPLLATDNITTAMLVTGLLAAVGAFCFSRVRKGTTARGTAFLAAALGICAVLNAASHEPVRLLFPKGSYRPTASIRHERWTIHGQVVSYPPDTGGPPFWSASPPPGQTAPVVSSTLLLIDGHAGTRMTGWDGRAASLYWTAWDVTSLPYHLRRKGDVAIVGVGGGRDVLTAIAAGSRHIDGIEINSAFTRLLEGPGREYAKIASRPEVTLVHDEARSYLTRSSRRYDVIQMSLIDTWAATGAGAFTLSENGLYTVQAWEMFLHRLKPGGVLGVSRFFAEHNASETSRLVSLATAALLRYGAVEPERHLALLALGNVATLLVSNRPLSSSDLVRLRSTVRTYGFRALLVPGERPSVPLLSQIAGCRSEAGILRLVDHQPFDYAPPTDERPYFFNLLKPRHLLDAGDVNAGQPGVITGNLMATVTLGILLAVVALLVLVVVLGPLLRSGLPRLLPGQFVSGVLYFGAIGAGFMLAQIGLMQRLSVYLGHPTYAVVVVLFSMILAAGMGSMLSERLRIVRGARPGPVFWLPVATAVALLAIALLIDPVTTATVEKSLAVRCLVACGMIVPLALLLGTFFPIGMRLMGELSTEATAWMWGINGATGVFASVLAVAISMWSGIHTNFYLAMALYLLVMLPAWWLRRPSGGSVVVR